MQLRSFQLTECDWLITICPQGSNNHWVFHCLPPGSEALTNHASYADPNEAIAAARKFVNKAIVRLAMGDWIDALLEEKRITAQEWKTALHWMGRLRED